MRLFSEFPDFLNIVLRPIFQSNLAALEGQKDAQLALANQLADDQIWSQYIYFWAKCYVESEIALSEAVDLFVLYLSQIYQGKNAMAAENLQSAKEWHQKNDELPLTFTWLGEQSDPFHIEDDDEEDNPDQISSDMMDVQSDPGSDPDSDYAPNSMDISSDISISDISMDSISPDEVAKLTADAASDLSPIYTNLVANPLILTKQNKKEWMAIHLATRGSCTLLIERWYRILDAFFYRALPANDTNAVLTFGFRKMGLVCALCEMRAIPPKTYRQDYWVKQVKVTGFAKLVCKISQPGAFNELLSPMAEASFRLYDWRNSLYTILHSWTPLGIELKVQWPKFEPDPSANASRITALMFFTILKDDNTMVPTAAHPSYAFFLLSQDNFVNAWHAWLGPALNYRNHLIINTDPKDLYSEIMNVNWTIPKYKGLKLARHCKVLWEIIQCTKRIRARCDIIRKDSQMPQQPCPTCANLPDDAKCIRRWQLTRLPNAKEFKETIITCADEGDILEPKTTKNKKPIKFLALSPNDLHLQPIAHRRDVLLRCGNDINILIDEKTGNSVGGIQFKPKAWNDKLHTELMASHTEVSKIPGIKRGNQFAQWAGGQMVAIGSRQAAGGIKGDCLREYSAIKGSTVEDIQRLFQYASTPDYMNTMLLGFCPEVREKMYALSRDSGGNPLGSTCGNMFTCNDYVAPQHADHDEGMSVCTQLEKSDCLADEYNFSYTEWGVYIVTEERTIWWFDSSHLHGTIMPRASTRAAARLRGGASSKGDHNTNPKRTYKSAQRRREAQINRERTQAYWNEMGAEMRGQRAEED
ncbi:hypothetical protein HWV62_24476 [Athelia sp. TMB]|nr:hypothetical protein HWV62_24476 [Athelia sp. TMB]